MTNNDNQPLGKRMSSACFVRSRISLAALAVCGVVGLAACGSGSSDDEGPAGAGLTLTGTAATGLAIAGQPVAAKCNGGSGDATTNDDGSYTVTVEGDASLPCTLRVTTSDGQVLHSLAVGTGSTARANITPVSELIVARLAGGDPAAFFERFDADAASSVNESSVQSASAAVVETLKSAGIDLSAFGDVLTAELRAATSANPTGNAFDQALDALGAALETSGTTLAELSGTVAQTSPQAVQAPSGRPSLPPELMLKKAAENCPSFRSGTYRVLIPMDSSPAARADTMDFDADSLTSTFSSDGGSVTWTADGSCRYVADTNGPEPGGVVKVAVSGAGVGVLLTDFSGEDPYRVGLFFPEQKIPLAELEGTWNTLEWERSDTSEPFSALMEEISFDASGRLTGALDCAPPDFASCSADIDEDAGAFEVNPEGGFVGTGMDLEELEGRLFAYRSGSGDLMLSFVDNTNTLLLATKKRAMSMPEVGAVTGSWTALTNAFGDASGELDDGSWTYVSADVPSSSVIRENPAGARQTLEIDSPREGMFRRVGVPPSEGSSGVAPAIFLGLQGMGLTAGTRVVTGDPLVQGMFMLSVAKPR